MRSWPVALFLGGLSLGVGGCSSNGGPVSPAAPTPDAPATGARIDIAEINGPYSFYPSPATVRADQIIVWRNLDTVTHHLVLDDGSIDTGTLAPGTLSQPETVGLGTKTYHCTIHPSMVGTVIVTGPSSSARASSAAE
jgi:plastocyanin